MPIRNRISGRPKVERNDMKLQSAGGRWYIGAYNVVGSLDTVVMYYDGERIGTYRDRDEAVADQPNILAMRQRYAN